MSPQIQTQTQTQTDIQEKKKLILKLFIRLLLYINEKNNTKKNDDTSSKEYLNSFLGYLQTIVADNKKYNNYTNNESKAFDEINVETITKQRLGLFKKQNPDVEDEESTTITATDIVT